MHFPSSEFSRFIRATHWRMVAVRLIENLAFVFVIGALISGLLMCALPIEAHTALLIPEIISAVCFLAAGAWTTRHYPSQFHAVREADRQLQQHDLLTTAFYLHRRPAECLDEMAAAILTTAETRCRSLSPGDVVLNRFGKRAWSGIGLTLLLAITLASLPMFPNPSSAAGGKTPPADAAPKFLRELPRSQFDQRSPLPGHVEKDEGPGEFSGSRGAAPASESAKGDSSGSNPENDSVTANRSTGKPPPQKPVGEATESRSSLPAPSVAGDETRKGNASVIAAPETQPSPGTSAANGLAGQPTIHLPDRRDSASDGSSGSEGPLNITAETPVPAEYRDLLQDYFRPDSAR